MLYIPYFQLILTDLDLHFAHTATSTDIYEAGTEPKNFKTHRICRETESTITPYYFIYKAVRIYLAMLKYNKVHISPTTLESVKVLVAMHYRSVWTYISGLTIHR